MNVNYFMPDAQHLVHPYSVGLTGPSFLDNSYGRGVDLWTLDHKVLGVEI